MLISKLFGRPDDRAKVCWSKNILRMQRSLRWIIKRASLTYLVGIEKEIHAIGKRRSVDFIKRSKSLSFVSFLS